MAFLFGRNNKPIKAVDLVSSLNDAILSNKQEKASKYLGIMKTILHGDSEMGPDRAQIGELVNEINSSQLLAGLINNMTLLGFEARKDFTTIFGDLLKFQSEYNTNATVDYLTENPELIENLIKGYDNIEIYLNCGMMLRECARHEVLNRIILYSKCFFCFFKYMGIFTFDVAFDAFSTMKELLNTHKVLASQFLEAKYEPFFEEYTVLLKSDNYVTKRQSLKLLGELLLYRSNYKVMTRYITDAGNLKLMMNLLREKSKSIRFEAFHVFKIFVANPNKSKPILDILKKNKEKLIRYLNSFQVDKDNDQFDEEKVFLVKQIEEL